MFAPDGHHSPVLPPSFRDDDSPHLRVVSPDSQPTQVNERDSHSPSLRRSAGDKSPAFEMKFLLDEVQAREVEARLRACLELDPHADPALGNGYQIASLYCDTPRLDVFRRVGRYGGFKLRLRQYGGDQNLFLERKARRGNRVRKRRSVIPLEDLARFHAVNLDSSWEGAWFRRQLLRNELAPVCLVSYERLAYFGSSVEGPLRLTFDRRVHGGQTSAWSLRSPESLQPLLAGRVVCEFKFRRSLPALFKSVIAEMQLTPVGVSKFRNCLMAAGIEAGGVAPHA